MYLNKLAWKYIKLPTRPLDAPCLAKTVVSVSCTTRTLHPLLHPRYQDPTPPTPSQPLPLRATKVVSTQPPNPQNETETPQHRATTRTANQNLLSPYGNC